MASTLLLAGGVFARRRRRRHRQRRADADASGGVSQQWGASIGEPLAGALAIGLLALLPFVALALLAFTRPPSQLRPSNIPYKQSGRLSYTASATPGPTYSGNRAVTGDALFTHVLNTVDLRFEYRFHAAAKHALQGRGSLDATLASTSGWQTAVRLGRTTSFRGDRAVLTAKLELSSLLALIRRVETSTAVRGSYTLSLVPHVSVDGSLDARPLHTAYSPQVQFQLSPLELQPLSSGGGLLSNHKTSATSPFTPSTAGSLTSNSSQPLFLSLKFARPTVLTARWIALGGILAVVLALLAAVAFIRPRVRGQSAAIRARYGRMIVAVERVWQLPGVAVIDVADMAALARIAERYDRSILHETTAFGEAFWVTDESGQFRYAIGAVEPSTVELIEAPASVEPALPDEQIAVAEPIVETAAPQHVEPVAVAEPYEPVQVAEPLAAATPVAISEPVVPVAAEPVAAAVEELPFDPLTHDAADAIVREWRAGWDTAGGTRAPTSAV